MKPIKLDPEDLLVVSFEAEAYARQAATDPVATAHTEDKMCTETACLPPGVDGFAIAC